MKRAIAPPKDWVTTPAPIPAKRAGATKDVVLPPIANPIPLLISFWYLYQTAAVFLGFFLNLIAKSFSNVESSS